MCTSQGTATSTYDDMPLESWPGVGQESILVRTLWWWWWWSSETLDPVRNTLDWTCSNVCISIRMTSWPICVYERLLNFWPIAINCITTSGSRIGMQIRIQFSYRPMADHYQSNAQQRAGRTDQKAIGQRTTTEDEESPLDDHRTSVLYTLEASSVSICLSVCLALAEEGSPITKDCACRHRKAIILGIYWWTQRPFRGVSHPVLPPPASFSLFIFVPLMVCSNVR